VAARFLFLTLGFFSFFFCVTPGKALYISVSLKIIFGSSLNFSLPLSWQELDAPIYSLVPFSKGHEGLAFASRALFFSSARSDGPPLLLVKTVPGAFFPFSESLPLLLTLLTFSFFLSRAKIRSLPSPCQQNGYFASIPLFPYDFSLAVSLLQLLSPSYTATKARSETPPSQIFLFSNPLPDLRSTEIPPHQTLQIFLLEPYFFPPLQFPLLVTLPNLRFFLFKRRFV